MFGPSGLRDVGSTASVLVLADSEPPHPTSDDMPSTPAIDPRMKRRRDNEKAGRAIDQGEVVVITE